MMKANIEPIWLDSLEDSYIDSKGTAFSAWSVKLRAALFGYVSSFKSENELFMNDIHTHDHDENSKQLKNEFFISSSSHERKRIPEKTWKRHSAFVIYHKKLKSQYSESLI